MKKIMHWIMLSCKKATELIEKKLLVNISFKEKVQLKMHKSFCDACTAYEKQSRLIDKLLNMHNNVEKDGSENISVVENEELKKRILDKIK